MTNFWDILRKYPPVLCRLLAKDRDGALTDEDISAISGLSLSDVYSISNQVSWNGIAIDKAERYLKGCMLDLARADHRRRAYDYLRKKGTFAYVSKSPVYRDQLLPRALILKRYRESLEKRGKTNGN